MGNEEEKGAGVAETDSRRSKAPRLEPLDSVHGDDASQQEDVISDAGEECEDFCFDTEAMHEFLETIKLLKVDPQCMVCKTTNEKLTLEEPKSRFVMCSGCSQRCCAGLATNEDGPMGHTRKHAKSACHPVALWIDQPDAAYCFQCERSLNLEVIASAAHAHEPYVVRGIPNRGNTCFANALVQCLLALGEVQMWMFGPDAPTGSLSVALKDLFVETTARNAGGAMLKPDKLLDNLGALNTMYKGRAQQDSHELLLYLCNGLNEDELLKRPPEMPKDIPTVVDSIFQSQVSDTLTCKCCLKPLAKPPESFYALSLALAPKGDDSHVPGSADKHKVDSLPSIKECLEWYFRKEVVVRNCDSCTKDEKPNTSQTEHDQQGKAEEKSDLFSTHDKQNASTLNQDTRTQIELENTGRHADKALVLSKLPPLLTLHVLRFEGTNNRSGHVKFEENLDVATYLDPRSEDKGDARYRLVGVIEHIGSSSNSGHDVAYVRGSSTGSEQQQSSGSSTWFRASDSTIRKVSLANVLKREAFLLFYERIED